MKQTILNPAILAAAVLAIAGPGVCRATAVYYNNFGSGSSYDVSEGLLIGNGFDGNNYAEAVQITSAIVTGNLSSLLLPLSCAAACPDPITVSLAMDNSGLPGTVLESFTVAGGLLGGLGNNNAPITLNSVVDPVLTAGSFYWVTVKADTNDSLAWNYNSIGDTANEAISTYGGVTWAVSGISVGALEVNVTPSAGVPEPPPLLTLLSGAFVLGIAKRFFRRQARGGSPSPVRG